jgi:hypothetical protein
MAEARIPVVALTPFAYRGQEVAAGEVCIVRPIEAAALFYRKKATPAPEDAIGVYLRRDMDAEPDTPDSLPTRRRYRRRDLTSDTA